VPAGEAGWVFVHFVDVHTPIRTTYTWHPDTSRSGVDPGTVPDDQGARRPDAAAMQLDPDRAASLLDRLYRTAILITRDPHEAEDLVQDTYELILRRPRELRGDSELRYMRAAMRRRHVDRHRESCRRVQVVALEDAPDVCSRAGEEPCRRAEQAEVLAAIRALPEIHRDVLVVTYVAGFTYSEAAAALGIKRGTVMSRVFRAREALVSALDGAIATASC
jgi:RNA polymerase sigma-70 factor (ECF subfamily)